MNNMDKTFTLRQLLDKYLGFNSYPHAPEDNLTGNRAISAFLTSLGEEKEPVQEVLPGTTTPLPTSYHFDKDQFLTLWREYQALKKEHA